MSVLREDKLLEFFKVGYYLSLLESEFSIYCFKVERRCMSFFESCNVLLAFSNEL